MMNSHQRCSTGDYRSEIERSDLFKRASRFPSIPLIIRAPFFLAFYLNKETQT